VQDRAGLPASATHFYEPVETGEASPQYAVPVEDEGAYGFFDNAAAVGGPESAVGGPESGAGGQIYAGSTGATAWAAEQAADIVYADTAAGAAGVVNVDTAGNTAVIADFT
jgi:hypothetical protein